MEEIWKPSPSFRYVLFEDSNKRFLGYMRAEEFRKLLDSDIVDQIETGRILQHESVSKGSIPTNATNKQALNRMDSLNVNELAVIDENGCFKGAITQDEIVRKILARVIREV